MHQNALSSSRIGKDSSRIPSLRAPDPAAGWLREGGIPPRPPPVQKNQIFQTFQMIAPIQPVAMVEVVELVGPSATQERVQMNALIKMCQLRQVADAKQN